jgi:sulfhydrogenase subunit beta (sulfur reductase)
LPEYLIYFDQTEGTAEEGVMNALKIGKEGLRFLFEGLKGSYRMIGPKLLDGVVVLDEIDYDDIPAGCSDKQKPGFYRASAERAPEIFSFSPGPHSFKAFLNPPVQQLFAFEMSKKGMTVDRTDASARPLAFFGARACDLAAIALLDKVFLDGPVQDGAYHLRRRDLFIVAVNCLSPGENCFCASMGTGPEVTHGFNIALTEIGDSFLVETAGDAAVKVIGGIMYERAEDPEIEEKKSRLSACKAGITKTLKTGDLPGIIYRNMEHPRWEEIARRDLACGNCTMVCPTCFCNSSFDRLSVASISGNHGGYSGVRVRSWDSCFSRNFARVHGGNFRPSRRARYRHWMTHKLAYWIEQFGAPGCVGCGRCITWCPAGIDLTHELEELRHAR